MTVLKWISENWVNLVIIVGFLAFIGYELVMFAKLPKEEQIKNVKAWLLYAVTEAEKELGSKTGALKLRLVYDRAVEKFTWLSTAVTFETFSGWVDEALEEMKKMLRDNTAVANYVGNGKQ